MSVGFVLQAPLSLSSVRPLELSLQPQPHFHSLARPPNLSFLDSIWRSFCVLWLFDSPHWSLFRRVWIPLAAHFVSSGLLIAPWGSSWLSFASQSPKICAFWSHLEGQLSYEAIDVPLVHQLELDIQGISGTFSSITESTCFSLVNMTSKLLTSMESSI